MYKKKASTKVLSQLFEQINNGHDREVLSAINTLCRQYPQDPNVLHLAAIAYSSDGKPSESKSLFQKAITLDSRQPELHKNFANLLRDLKEIESARRHYNIALTFAPNFGDAWKNLAILELDQENLQAAQEAAEKALTGNGKSYSTITLLGNIYRKQGNYQHAIEQFERVINNDPHHLNSIYGLAQTRRESGEPEVALHLFEQARKISPNSIEVLYNIANTLLDLHRYQEAEKTLLLLLELNPQYIEAHKTLNELYWQTNNTQEFCQSYRKATSKFPSNKNLKIQLVESLLSAQQVDDAKEIVDAELILNQDPRFTYLLGRILEESSELEQAKHLYKEAYQVTRNLDFAKRYIIALIRLYEYQTANLIVSEVIDLHPNDQLLWALQGICWRTLEDSRYKWLNNFENLVKSYLIPTPPGYSSRAEFLQKLKTTLQEMHKMQSEPLNQSVKMGVQTPGRLLQNKNPVIQQLKSVLQAVVGQYIAELPGDKSHPFLRRKSAAFKFSGSWSVLLKKGGYHVNHVHPEGWISSAFYVSLPQSVTSEPKSQAGHIKFGESPYGLEEYHAAERVIRPKEGLVVLFPSYMWHGTVELSQMEEEARLTAPFDIIPL